jgi:hypothetical protein
MAFDGEKAQFNIIPIPQQTTPQKMILRNVMTLSSLINSFQKTEAKFPDHL